MRFHRLGRPAIACRLAVVLSLSASSAFLDTSVAAAEPVAGVVIDQTGRPVPRASVRALDRAGAEAGATFSDERGGFLLSPAGGDCQIEVTLGGFAPATAPCGANVRLVLTVAPVRESVVVTATRTETPASQSGVSVTTFTADDLARRRTPLVADLLRSSPGAMLIRTGAPGAVTSLFVRGGESSYNKVLLDGIPLNEPGGTFNFNNLTTDNLERVEIVRGAQSALFGSDAMSSVVQLFTRRADRSDDRPHVRLSIEGGNYGTAQGSAAVSGGAGNLDYAFGAAGSHSDNREPNSDFTNTTLSANVGIALGASASLRVIGRGELGRTGTPGQTAFGRPDRDAFFERHDGTGGVTFEQQLNAAVRQRASYSVTSSRYQSTNLILDPPYTASFEGRVASFQSTDFLYESRTSLDRHHASYQADIRLANDGRRGSQLLTLLADWDGERATLEDRLGGTKTPASRNNIGVSLQQQATWRRVMATGGLRLEHNASFGDVLVPRGSLVVVAREGRGRLGDTRVRVGAGSGIKEPTIIQSFSPSPFFLGNPNLQPERSRSVEAGVEQRIADDRLRVEATWFDNEYRNLVSTRTTNFQTFEAQFFNIGLSRARGAEFAAEAAPMPSLHVRGSYTFLDSEIVDSTSPFSTVLKAGQWLFRRPRHSGYVGAAWSRDRFTADLSGVFVGRFVDSDFSSLQPPLLENPGFGTWDLRASYALTKEVRALLSIDNLANNNYLEPLGYRALGRAVRFGLRVGL